MDSDHGKRSCKLGGDIAKGLSPAGWPNLTEAHLRQLLHEMQVDVSTVKEGEKQHLRVFLDTNLMMLQHKSPWTDNLSCLNPHAMPRCASCLH